MKICIIKLGADGDVLRTIPLAKAMKSKWKNAEITWVTRGEIATLLNNLPFIERTLDISQTEKLREEKWDIIYNFDVEEQATSLAFAIKAEKKYGFYSEGGYPAAFNAGAEYYLNTMFDDELKKTNTKTYQEMMFMAAELPYQIERYDLILTDTDKRYAQDFTNKNKVLGKKIIGIHMGAGSRWPSKAWHESRVKEFIVKAKKLGSEIVLFGGPNEVEKHAIFIEELKKEGIEILRNNPSNSKREFAALVSLCDVVVCSDSFALHVSLGMQKKTVALFFVTSPDEVEGYGLLTKIVSPQLKEFFPERSDEYNEGLVKSISADEVLNAVER